MRFQKSSGNVFRDLGLPDADAMLRKAAIVARINQLIRSKKTALIEAANLAEVHLPRLELWRRGQFRDASEDELKRCLENIETAE